MNRRAAEGVEAVSENTARRLSIYLRGLEELQSAGVKTVSSQNFARRLHLNPAQMRKDLALFGEFGIRGVGYGVASLHERLVQLLGIAQTRNVIICGAGHLGQALGSYGGFNSGGFRVSALFDVDPSKFGRDLLSGASVLPFDQLPGFLARERVDIAVIAVPAAAALPAFETLTRNGVRAVLNFSAARLPARPDVFVKDVDLKIHLETLSFYLTNSS